MSPYLTGQSPPKEGVYSYHHHQTDNMMTVETSVECRYDSNDGAHVYFTDRALNKKGEVIVSNYKLVNGVVTALHRRQWDVVRVLSKSRGLDDIQRNWVEEWKTKRCMHGGVPNKPAMLLLTGLHKRISARFETGKSGQPVRDTTMSRLLLAGLVDLKDPVPMKKRSGVMTNFYGLQVLEYWASKNGSFEPFFMAYCPPKFRDKFVGSLVLERLMNNE